MYEDNRSAISFCNNKDNNGKWKHIDVTFRFINDETEKSNIVVKYLKSSDQLADIITKPLG